MFSLMQIFYLPALFASLSPSIFLAKIPPWTTSINNSKFNLTVKNNKNKLSWQLDTECTYLILDSMLKRILRPTDWLFKWGCLCLIGGLCFCIWIPFVQSWQNYSVCQGKNKLTIIYIIYC